MTLVGAIRMAPQLSDRRVSCSAATDHLWAATGRIAEILNDFEILVTSVRTASASEGAAPSLLSHGRTSSGATTIRTVRRGLLAGVPVERVRRDESVDRRLRRVGLYLVTPTAGANDSGSGCDFGLGRGELFAAPRVSTIFGASSSVWLIFARAKRASVKKILLSVVAMALPLTAQQRSPMPAAAAAKVDYEKDVKPLLAQNCYSCHGDRVQQSGLRLDLRQNALRGGDYGPVILPGKSADSKLIRRLVDGDGGMQMPPTGALSPEDIGILRAWIDQGADFRTTRRRSAAEADRSEDWPRSIAAVRTQRRRRRRDTDRGRLPSL